MRRSCLTRFTRALGAMKIFAIPFVWLIGISVAVWSGFGPDPYIESVLGMFQPYPTYALMWAVLLMSAEAALLMGVLRPASYRRSWGRALSAMCISVIFLVYGMAMSTHAPSPIFVYIWWALLLAAASVLLVLWSVVVTVCVRTAPNKLFKQD